MGPPAGTEAAIAPVAYVRPTMSPSDVRPPAVRTSTRRTTEYSVSASTPPAKAASIHGQRTSARSVATSSRCPRAATPTVTSTASVANPMASRRRPGEPGTSLGRTGGDGAARGEAPSSAVPPCMARDGTATNPLLRRRGPPGGGPDDHPEGRLRYRSPMAANQGNGAGHGGEHVVSTACRICAAGCGVLLTVDEDGPRSLK